jgi:diguanylate cyclase (GGDEF)-like protein
MVPKSPRSIFRETVVVILMSGAVGCFILLAWGSWMAWGEPTAAGDAALAQRVRIGVVAVTVCCVLALFGVYGALRRFQSQLDAFEESLHRLPSSSIAVAPESVSRVQNADYEEAKGIARAVEDVTRAFAEREHNFERARMKLRDQLQQRTQEAQEAGDKAHQLAMIDPLTKLPNRTQLNQSLDSALETALANRSHCVALYVDVDHFKRLNDTLGHDLGDQVLLRVANTLRAHAREEDITARLSGDAFVVVLRNLPADGARGFVERFLGMLYADLRNPIEFDGRSTLITLSIGAAVYPTDGGDGATLLRAADAAMYVAKKKGRNRAEWYQKEREQRAARVNELEQGLRDAIANRQLTVMYQPQVRAEDGIPVGVEALVRWNHPTRGLTLPGQFIGVAEQSGLIVPLGQRVLEMAFLHAKRWNARDMNMRISINLSVRQLEQQGWVESLQALVEKHDLPASLIDLEITESMIADEPTAMEKTLRKLSARGFKLSLDDFGTGYSSLNYLARFPFDHVKIDRQFVQDIANEASRNVVQSIIALGHTLNMRTIAEGVETPQQFRILREMGCDEVQGYFVSEPMVPDELPTWWQQRVETTEFLTKQDVLQSADNVREISAGRSTSATHP